MRIFVTGVPGSGKTTLAKALGQQLHYPVFSDKSLAKKRGAWSTEGADFVVNLTQLGSILHESVQTHSNGIWEGHLLCEQKIAKVDLVIVLSASWKTIVSRLSKRKSYPVTKILDNAWLAENQYCEKNAKKRFGQKVRVLSAEKPIKALRVSVVAFMN